MEQTAQGFAEDHSDVDGHVRRCECIWLLSARHLRSAAAFRETDTTATYGDADQDKWPTADHL